MSDDKIMSEGYQKRVDFGPADAAKAAFGPVGLMGAALNPYAAIGKIASPISFADELRNRLGKTNEKIVENATEAKRLLQLRSELEASLTAICALTPPLQHKGGETEAGDKLAEFMKLDGAVKWEGGEMPVPVGATVDVLFNDGNLIEASRAEIWSRVPHGHDYWRDKPFNTRIVAYRIIATMSEHDRSAKSPLDERVWVHFMSAGGFSGGNGWSDELDWTKVDLYEIRPEGPPHLALSEPPISTLQASSGEGETLPSMDDIIDPDFTGGLLTEEYLERLHKGTLGAVDEFLSSIMKRGGTWHDGGNNPAPNWFVDIYVPAASTSLGDKPQHLEGQPSNAYIWGGWECAYVRTKPMQLDGPLTSALRLDEPADTPTEPAAYSPVNNADEPVTKPEADVFSYGLQAEAEAKKDPVSKLFGAGGLFGKREVVS